LGGTNILSRTALYAGRLLAALLALWLMWLVAQGVLRIIWPAPQAASVRASPLSPDEASRAVIAASLFGSSGTGAPTSAAEPAQSPLNLVLKGVYAPQRDFPGFAVLSIDGGRDIGVLAGSEVKAGVKLHAVNPDHILLSRDGVVERVSLAPLQFRAAIPGQLGPAAALNVRATAANSYTVSRGEFGGLLRDPRQLASLAQLASNPGGGIVITEGAFGASGGIASKLGLQQGDIIQKINGQPVAGKDDLLIIARQSPAAGNVSVEGMRNGQPLRLTYNLQP
jgi:general secretion pathway protein C